VVAAVTTWTMSVRLTVLVVARVVVFARSVRVARVSVGVIVTVVMVNAAMAGLETGGMTRVVVAVILGVVVLMARVVMIRIALPGQRPQGICGSRMALYVVEILAFEPHRSVIVFALLGGAVRAWDWFHHASGENSVMGSATWSSMSASMPLMCRSAAT
jgi:hypothetical protein